MTTSPAPRLLAALGHLRTVTSGGALAGVLVAGTLAALPPAEPEGTLVVDPGPVAPVVRQLPVPGGAGALPEAERVVSAKEDDHGEEEAHGRARVGAGPAVASLAVPRSREFSMLGVTWADARAGQDVVVEIRTRGEQGWSEWEQLHVQSAAPRDAAGVRGGTEPIWVGKARGAQVRIGGTRPRGLELSLIDPGEGPDLSLQSSVAEPGIITRRQWGADERLTEPCSNGTYGRTTEAVTIHHTVNSNSYARHESDNLMRGILAYHTQSNGWCDIGYNFLVDKYGQVFQGRDGSLQRQVWGAHAGDNWVNEQSTGIALIGNFETAAPTWAMKNAVIDLAAWRLDAFYRNPQGRANIVGSTYPVVMGHRDVKSTACPGRHAYAWLPSMRTAVAAKVNASTTQIQRRWLNQGGQSGWIGWPSIGEHTVGNGRRTGFRSADLYWHARTGVHWVRGAIRAKYTRIGGPDSVIGFPSTNELSGRRAGVALNHFQRGTIYWSKATGAHEIHGAIRAAYHRYGGDASRLGTPTTDEFAGRSAGVRRQYFQRGTIYWSKATGAREIHGAIRATYHRLGADASLLGAPTTNEFAGRSAGVRRQHFQRGTIYWSRATGAHEVHGAIRAAYHRHGGDAGSLGLPTSNEYPTSNGARNDFQHGWIEWDKRLRQAVVHRTG